MGRPAAGRPGAIWPLSQGLLGRLVLGFIVMVPLMADTIELAAADAGPRWRVC